MEVTEVTESTEVNRRVGSKLCHQIKGCSLLFPLSVLSSMFSVPSVVKKLRFIDPLLGNCHEYLGSKSFEAVR